MVPAAGVSTQLRPTRQCEAGEQDHAGSRPGSMERMILRPAIRNRPCLGAVGGWQYGVRGRDGGPRPEEESVKLGLHLANYSFADNIAGLPTASSTKSSRAPRNAGFDRLSVDGPLLPRSPQIGPPETEMFEAYNMLGLHRGADRRA